MTTGTCPSEEGGIDLVFTRDIEAERGKMGEWRERKDSLRANVVGLGVRSS